MAVEDLPDHAARDGRAAPYDTADQTRGLLAASPRCAAADVPVAQLTLVGAPRELEGTQALVVPVGAAEVQPPEPPLTAPLDRLHEQEVVRARPERPVVGGAVLVEQRVGERQE